MIRLFRSFLTIILVLAPQLVSAQYPVLIHSHNDYTRTVPFYEAYSQKLASIECDMWYVGGRFLVGHDLEDLDPEMTFDKLYFNPVIDLFKKNGGHAWADDENRILRLLLEIKSDNPEAYLKALVKKLKKYPEVFDPSVNPKAVRICMTGNIPAKADFGKYPDYIKFDYPGTDGLSAEDLSRIEMISYDFGEFSQWNGKGTLIYDEEVKIRELIAKVHALGKPIRFWGGPDSVTCWYTFLNFGIDYINTDHPEQCCDFFSDWQNKNYGILGEHAPVKAGVTKTDRLDKITRGFSGFHNERLQLEKTIETYTPTYLNDGAVGKPIKNVILLIGDGMGYTQMVAADRVNFGLTMMNMRHMGMINNSSKDAFTTDSAASGSGLATGVLHENRHIAATWEGEPIPSLTDFFYERGKSVGVVTLGDMADATPAAFFSHCAERDSADIITRFLLDGKLTVLAGSGEKYLTTQRHDGLNMPEELRKIGYTYTNSVSGIDESGHKVICIDEDMDEAAEAGTVGLLADATRRSINKLAKASDKGFFLMVEGAKVDYAGHSRCLPGAIMETLSLDMAVKEALKFADSNGETLVVVTADHETGALVLLDGNLETGHVTGYFVSNDHSPLYPVVLSYGPGASSFMGRYYQRDVANKIKSFFENK